MARSRSIDLIDKSLSLFSQQTQNQGTSIAVVGESIKVTGVARYLAARPSITRVSKYMDTMHTLTSVSKYLKRKEKNYPITGVSKYILKTVIASKNAPAMTNVTKYAVKLKMVAPPVTTGIDRYVAKQLAESSRIKNLTGVAKYQAEKDLNARKKWATAIIAKYLEEDAKQAKEKNEVVIDVTPSVDLNDTTRTGVACYIQKQAALANGKPAASGVAKYLARKIVEASKKPRLSRVTQYIDQQQKLDKQRPVVSSVGKYLKSQPVVTKKNQVISGVEKYLTHDAELMKNKPMDSKVAKYLTKQARDIEKKRIADAVFVVDLSGSTGISRYLDKHINVKTNSNLALEGEFIPARQAELATSVDKYLKNQARV